MDKYKSLKGHFCNFSKAYCWILWEMLSLSIKAGCVWGLWTELPWRGTGSAEWQMEFNTFPSLHGEVLLSHKMVPSYHYPQSPSEENCEQMDACNTISREKSGLPWHSCWATFVGNGKMGAEVPVSGLSLLIFSFLLHEVKVGEH